MKIIELLLKLLEQEEFIIALTSLVWFIVRKIEKPKAEKKAIEKYKQELQNFND